MTSIMEKKSIWKGAKKMLINTEDRSQNEINTMSIINVSEDIFSKVLKEIITQKKAANKR